MSLSRITAAVLCSCAFAAMAGSATQARPAADDLSALKAELNELQGRVDHLQSAARGSGNSLVSSVSLTRGAGASEQWKTERPGDTRPDDTGLSIVLEPAADLPSPVRSVTIGGYVKGDVIHDFDQDLGDDFNYGRIGIGPRKGRTRLHARQSRFNIKSVADTRAGAIRTLIEGDFFGSSGPDFRLRHAWGEWDVSPNWTVGVGQYWRNFMSPITGIPTVDFAGDVGLIGRSRSPQLRLSWNDGPLTAAFSVEQPDSAEDLVAHGAGKMGSSLSRRPAGASNNAPDVAARVQYDLPGDNAVVVSGMVRNYHLDRAGAVPADDALGWGIQGAVNVAMADPVLLTASVMYGQGLGDYVLGAPFGAYVRGGRIKLVNQLGIFAGATVFVNESTSVNLGWGYLDQRDSDIAASQLVDASMDVMSAHANVMWQPVRQLRLGAEVMWAERERLAVDGKATDDAWRGQVGAWFFF